MKLKQHNPEMKVSFVFLACLASIVFAQNPYPPIVKFVGSGSFTGSGESGGRKIMTNGTIDYLSGTESKVKTIMTVHAEGITATEHTWESFSSVQPFFIFRCN